MTAACRMRFHMVSSIKQIAITGGIACGKSSVAGWLPALGGEVIDADEIVHELEAPGGAAVEAIVAEFGGDVSNAEGGIDRRALGRLVFDDEAARKRLNAMVHPLVAARLKDWLARPVDGTVRFRAAVIPLLHEVGWTEPRWDAVIAVVARRATQLRRLEARGLSHAEACARIDSQWPCECKARLADFVIRNDDDLSRLHAKTIETVKRLLENEP